MMLDSIPVIEGQAVFGKDEFVYKSVLEDFCDSKFIGIITYNISPRTDSNLLKALKDACINGAKAVVITNIPQRFSSYYTAQIADAAKKKIDLYMRQLNPRDYAMRLSPFFTFNNHAKIILTDNNAYWGSCNYSDESKRNFECGTISTDKGLIEHLRDSFFPYIQSKSVPYYKYNFALAIANLESLILACKEVREKLFEASFEPWVEYETNFKEEWVFRTTDSGISVKLIQGYIEFFSQFDDALRVVNEIIDKYSDKEELPEQVALLKGLFDEYKSTFFNFYNTIMTLFEDLKQLAQFDTTIEANKKLNYEYGMEAFDEELNLYAERAMNEASEEYRELIEESEHTIRDALDYLKDMIHYFEQLKSSLYALLEVNSMIDNTGV